MTVERELDSLNSLLLGLPGVASFIIQAVGGKDLVASLFKEQSKKKEMMFDLPESNWKKQCECFQFLLVTLNCICMTKVPELVICK